MMPIAFMIKAGRHRLQLSLKGHSTTSHLPESGPHARRSQYFQKHADPRPGVTVYGKELSVSTAVTLFGRWRFVAPANGTDLAARFEFLPVATKLVNGLLDFRHHTTKDPSS